jgi:hypothetical protein
MLLKIHTRGCCCKAGKLEISLRVLVNILRPTFYAIRLELLLALKCLQPNKYQNSGIHLIRTKKNTKGRIIQCRPLPYPIIRHICNRTILV